MQTYSRVYDSYASAQQALERLEAMGVPSADISLIANKHVSEQYSNVDDASGTETGATVGAAVGGGAGLLAGIGLLAIPGLGPVVAAGWLASTLAGAVAGSAAGGIIGALTDMGVSDEDAHVYSEVVRRGGTLLTVRTELSADRINAALDQFGPVEAAVRRRQYLNEGWQKYDPNAPAYQPTREEIERIRRPM